MAWNDLPLSDKARMMQLAVNSGITDLRTIQEVYNKFAEGGETDSNLTQAQKDSLIARVNTSNADFVKRLQDENRKYIDYGDSIATHRMAYATDENGNAIVYPEVQSVGDTLQWFRGWDAYDRAVNRGDTLQMSIPEAEWFTTNYKKYYPKGKTFAEGGGIHIKPSHRGKFTALKERTGHSASWFKENGTPAQKKMATFALNARKWHHAEGGPIVTTADSATVHNPHYEADRENKMYDYLRNKGLDHTEAVALLGNLSVESYLDADLHQINGPAYGLMQAEGSRKDAILNYYDNPYVFGNGLTANEQQQLDYIVDKGILNYTPGEWGKKGYRGARDARNAFLNEEDPIKASDIITRNFLRPGKPHTERRRTMTKYFDESQNERNKYRFNPYKSLTR